MRKPIFITGYERSGTTLLRRLISMHPNLQYELVHENIGPMMKAKTRGEAITNLTYPATQAGKKTGSTMSLESGIKMPYLNYSQAKKQIMKFLDLFIGEGGSVIHIVRHPVGAIDSQMRTFKKKFEVCFKNYFEAVPNVSYIIKKLTPVSLEVSFTELLTNPSTTLTAIYEWLDDPFGVKARGSYDKDYIDKVLSTKNPWDYRGRIMPGLRYFDSVGLKQSKTLMSAEQIEKVIEKNNEYDKTKWGP
jgi:hypothetical protein